MLSEIVTIGINGNIRLSNCASKGVCVMTVIITIVNTILLLIINHLTAICTANVDRMLSCILIFFSSHQQSFSYVGTGLIGLSQY